MYRPQRLWPGELAIATLLGLAMAFGTAGAAPPGVMVKALRRAIAAYQAGDLSEMHKLAAPILEDAGQDELADADQFLADQGLNVRLTDLVVGARLQLATNQETAGLRRPGAVELPLALVALSARAEELLQPVRETLATPVGVQAPREAIEEQARELPALRERIAQADSVLAHLYSLTRRLRRREQQRLDQAQQAIAQRDFKDERAKLEELTEQLVERLVDLSLLRLAEGVTTVADESAGFRQRYAAAARVSESLDALHANWKLYRDREAPGTEDVRQAERDWQAQEKHTTSKWAARWH